MLRFFCIGDSDTCCGFALAGVAGENPETSEEAEAAFDRVRHDPAIAIVIITEEIAAHLQGRIMEHRVSGSRPMVVEIPANLSDDFEGGSLMDSIRQAIGISL